MPTPDGLADLLARVVAGEHAALRAVPDGPATARPNRPSGKGWSMREEMGHLVDSAVNNHNRIARAALDGAYAGPDYAENAWVDLHGYVRRPFPGIVAEWHACNTGLVHLVRNIPAGRLEARCTVGDSEPFTLGFLVEDYVLHLRHHVDQVLRRPAVTKYPQSS